MSEQAGRAGRAALLAAASAVAMAPVLAAAQDAAQASGPQRRFVSNWQLDTRATYSDNYRRLPEDLALTANYLGRVPVEVEPGEPPVDPVVTVGQSRRTERIDPLSNTILSATLSGATVYERPAISGIVSGSLTVGTYTDTASVDDRLNLSSYAVPPPPAGLLPLDPEADPATPPTFLGVSFGFRQEEETFVQPNLVGSATARLIDDLLYVDGSALAIQRTLSRRQDVQAEGAAQVGDRTTYGGLSVSPYIFREMGANATVEARYRVSALAVVDEDFSGELGGRNVEQDGTVREGRFGNDALGQDVLLEYRSGDLLDRVSFAIRGAGERIEESGSEFLPELQIDRLTAAGDVAYEASRDFAVTATLGVDDVTVDDGRRGNRSRNARASDEYTGAFWSVGFRYNPSQRTQLELSAGERFGGTQINGDLRWRPTDRLTVSGRIDRSLGTGLQGTADGLRGFNSRSADLIEQLSASQAGSSSQLLDRAVGLRGDFGSTQNLASGAQVRDSAALNATYNAGRSSIGAGVSYSKTQRADRVIEGEPEDVGDTQLLTVSANARRQVSRRLNVTGRVRLQRAEGRYREDFVLGLPDDAESTEAFVSAEAAYALGRRISATARVYHARRELTDEANTALGGIGLDYKENAVSAGLRWTF